MAVVGDITLTQAEDPHGSYVPPDEETIILLKYFTLYHLIMGHASMYILKYSTYASQIYAKSSSSLTVSSMFKSLKVFHMGGLVEILKSG